jgi:hypothetical protein
MVLPCSLTRNNGLQQWVIPKDGKLGCVSNGALANWSESLCIYGIGLNTDLYQDEYHQEVGVVDKMGERSSYSGRMIPANNWMSKRINIEGRITHFLYFTREKDTRDWGWRKENLVKISSPYILQVPLVFYSITNHITCPSGTFFFPPLVRNSLISIFPYYSMRIGTNDY